MGRWYRIVGWECDCPKPTLEDLSKARVAAGSIWECQCGKLWELDTYSPGKHASWKSSGRTMASAFRRALGQPEPNKFAAGGLVRKRPGGAGSGMLP